MRRPLLLCVCVIGLWFANWISAYAMPMLEDGKLKLRQANGTTTDVFYINVCSKGDCTMRPICDKTTADSKIACVQAFWTIHALLTDEHDTMDNSCGFFPHDKFVNGRCIPSPEDRQFKSDLR